MTARVVRRARHASWTSQPEAVAVMFAGIAAANVDLLRLPRQLEGLYLVPEQGVRS